LNWWSVVGCHFKEDILNVRSDWVACPFSKKYQEFNRELRSLPHYAWLFNFIMHNSRKF
jgi:hypothetical protein